MFGGPEVFAEPKYFPVSGIRGSVKFMYMKDWLETIDEYLKKAYMGQNAV